MIVWSTNAVQLTATELTTQIIQKADSDVYSKEALVQRYYSVEDLYEKVKKISSSHPQLARLEIVKTNLRKEIDQRKNALSQTKLDDFLTTNKSYIQGVNWLSTLCKNQYTLADDWAYALDLPTALVLATWDMESSCGRYKPSNGDGVFQIVAQDYGSDDNFTKGQWIMMMYDYAKLVKDKVVWYHNSNNLSPTNCATKNTTTLGQTAPICLTYTSMDMDSLIKYGALYNGLANATIKGNIQPANPNYVFGKFGSEYQSANKDGIIMRVLKILDYSK